MLGMTTWLKSNFDAIARDRYKSLSIVVVLRSVNSHLKDGYDLQGRDLDVEFLFYRSRFDCW